ncbi:MAG: transketolase [Candidatus Hydrothermae bacterium]|nr:transketolase [Candidatus Hydrothermae bacterium]
MVHPAEERVITTLRMWSVDMIETAHSGHPGLPLGAAPILYVLFFETMRHNPRNPSWWNRDRFLLSAGHGSALLYATLHLSGYDLPLEELRRFRQLGSRTPGHPERGLTPGVEVTTGPLGQGFANGVGMAIAERFLAARYNREGFPVVDHWTYALVSDGDLMEGISHEAASLAGHLGLGKLIYFYDDNRISIDGPTDLTFTEDVRKRFEAYGWQVLEVEDGNDLDALRHALQEARSDTDRPTLIRVRTHIGYGSPLQDDARVHGAPLGTEHLQATRAFFRWPDESFYLPEEAARAREQRLLEGQAQEQAWRELWEKYRTRYPAEARELEIWMRGVLPEGWARDLPTFTAGEMLATRAASGQVIAALSRTLPHLVGGSADLTDSNKTRIPDTPPFSREHPEGRMFHFGVREHAMAGILNGMAYHGGVRPFGATFLVFSDYLRPALRIAALSHLPVIFVFTHDSLWLGEDGPTHQPVEHLAALRAIPNLVVIRPADAEETREAWIAALQRRDGPTALILTRQKVPTLVRAAGVTAKGLHRGAYVIREASQPPGQVVLLASGSEVALALDTAEQLEAVGVPTRVVSFPSWELFAQQEETYRAAVLPEEIPLKVVIEAARLQGWERWAGPDALFIGVGTFGASAPYRELQRHLGFTAEAVVSRILERIKD